MHGVTDEELRLLVDRRVLRIEAQRGTQRVELTHDLLTRVVREHRDREREKARTRRQRTRAAAFAAVGVVLLGLVVMFGWLYVKAEQQATIATARRLAAEAQALSNQRPRALPLATCWRGIHQAVPDARRRPVSSLWAAVASSFRDASTKAPESCPRRRIQSGRNEAGDGKLGRRGTGLGPGHGAAALHDHGRSSERRPLGRRLSPDGKFLATGDFGGTTTVWDVGSGALTGPARKSRIGHPMKMVAFSGDGRYLAGASEGGATVWDADAKEVFSTPEHDGAFSCVPLSSFLFSPDGTHAAAACRGQVRIWETASWKPVVTIPVQDTTGIGAAHSSYRVQSGREVSGQR